MKACHFRLQTSLDVAQRRQKVAREDLQICIAQRNIVQMKYEQAQNRRDELQTYLREKKGTFQNYLITTDYLRAMSMIILDLELALQTEEEKVEAARIILANYSKEKRTLEKLKARDWTEYLHQLNLEEQKVIDEIALNKHFRNEN